MEIADRPANSLASADFPSLCLPQGCKGTLCRPRALVQVHDSAGTQGSHPFSASPWLPGAISLRNASRFAAEGYADLGKAKATELGCGTSSLGLSLPRVPAQVLAFSSFVTLGKLRDFSQHQFPDLSNGTTLHTGGCKDAKDDACTTFDVVPGIQ